MRHLYFVLLAICLTPGLYAGVLKGRITDNHGNVLPYATVYIEGTTNGVTSGANGYYQLTVAPGLYKVVCQYIGYKQSTFNVSFSGDETIEHNFTLKDQNLEMKEVVIHATDEDPAYRVIRNTIRRRQFHLDQVHSFQTSIYLKGVARSRKMPKKFMGQKTTDETDAIDSAGRGVLYLTEEYADYYATGNKQRTVIHSVHESGNPGGLGFSQFPSVLTFYDNNLQIFGKDSRGFISPISDNALFYYKYKLLGEFKELGRTIYKIQVKQKRSYEPCFDGTIYIVDSEWAIHSLNMSLAKKSGMDMVDTFKIDQLFLPLHNDTWVIKNQRLYFTINLLGFDVTADGVTVYNNQKVNEPIPDSIFADKVVSSYDANANKKDSAYWKNARPMALEKDEKENFVVRDSLVRKFDSPAYKDSLRRRDNRLKPAGLLLKGYFFSDSGYRNTWGVYHPLLGLNFNIVEGYNVAPKFYWSHYIDTGKTLYMDAAARYGFSNTHFNAIGRIYYFTRDRAFPARTWLYSITAGKYVFQYNPENPVSQLVNSLSSLFYREADLKVYERWEATGYLAHNYGTGWNWSLRASYQVRLPLDNTTNYAWVDGDEGGYKSNTPITLLQQATAWEKNDAAIVHGLVSYKPGYTYTQYPDHLSANGSSWPRFTLSYEKGIPGIINSVSDFDKWRFSVRGDLRMKLFGLLQYNLATGGFLNSRYVSIPDLMHLYGNRGVGLASPYLQSFQFAQYYEFSNKAPLYGEGHVEYNLMGLLTNKIPLLREAGWHLLVGSNAFYADPKMYYTEAFVGIDNIGYKLVRLLRVDFVQSWDSHMGRNSGIRFGINLKNATVSKAGSLVPSEW